MSFQALALTASVTMGWPYNSTGGTSVAKINDLTSTAAWSITMPPATQVSTGEDVLFRNTSAFTIQILKADGTGLATVSSGTAVYIYITDNTTTAGSWAVINYGSTSSSVSAAALAGYGLVASGSLLNTTVATSTLSGTATIATTHLANLVNYTSGSGAVALTNPATLGAGFYCLFHNSGTATVTLTPAAGTIDGAGTFQVQPSESLIIVGNGVNFFTVGYGRSTSYQFTQQVVNITTATYTLSASQAAAKLLKFTGNQTGTPVITIPGIAGVFYIINAMTAPTAQLNFTTGAGTSTNIPIATSSTILCDGTNVSAATTSASYTATTISLADGAAAAPSLAFTNETSTGFYRVGAGDLGVSVSGTKVADYTSAGLTAIGIKDTALTASSAVATDASKNLVSVTNTGTGNNVLATSPSLTTPTVDSLNGGQLAGFRNRIINGGMRVAQRGVTQSLTSGSVAYGSLDRWAANMGVTAAGTFTQQSTSTLVGFSKMSRLWRTAGSASTGALSMVQVIESTDCYGMQGKSVTLSFYAWYDSTDFSSSGKVIGIQIYSGTGTDQGSANIGTWTGLSTLNNTTQAITATPTRYSVTVSVPSTTTELVIQFVHTPTGTAGTYDYFNITGVQLEVGTVATPFEQIPIQTSLALCQRYYRQWNYPNGSATVAVGHAVANNTAQGVLSCSIDSMRIANPTAATSGAALQASTAAGVRQTTSSWSVGVSSGDSAIEFSITTTGTLLVAGNASTVYVPAGGGTTVITANAEL
jgi:hypothetical protein